MDAMVCMYYSRFIRMYFPSPSHHARRVWISLTLNDIVDTGVKRVSETHKERHLDSGIFALLDHAFLESIPPDVFEVDA